MKEINDGMKERQQEDREYLNYDPAPCLVLESSERARSDGNGSHEDTMVVVYCE